LHASGRDGHGPHHRLRPLPAAVRHGLTACPANIPEVAAVVTMRRFNRPEVCVEKLKAALIIGFLRLFAMLPWRWVQRLGAAIGWLSYRLPNRSRGVTRINLSRCLPELSE